MRKELTSTQKETVINLYFKDEMIITEIADKLNHSKSVVGRVIKEYKEIVLGGNKNYLPYPQHYYRKKLKQTNKRVEDEMITKLDDLEISIEEAISKHTDSIIRLNKQLNLIRFISAVDNILGDAE
jgi:predicted DNA-binding protein YlxM (UPF0122 family)